MMKDYRVVFQLLWPALCSAGYQGDLAHVVCLKGWYQFMEYVTLVTYGIQSAQFSYEN